MIVSNRKHAFGAKCGTIHTDTFKCVVSTAKEGLLEKQSTMLLEGDMIQDRANCMPCGKITYTSSLGSSDRLELHDNICKRLDELGENGLTLRETLDRIIEELEEQGVVNEAVNFVM